ncbi:MAG: hypothetical protein V2A67_06435 [Bacteroidota bacterium]
MFILAIGSIVFGLVGYLAFRDLWIHYVFAHIGGLGVMALLGCWAGTIAIRKGYSYWSAFLTGLVPPIVLGILAVCLIDASGGRGCGGVVSISASIIVVILYMLARRKHRDPQM